MKSLTKYTTDAVRRIYPSTKKILVPRQYIGPHDLEPNEPVEPNEEAYLDYLREFAAGGKERNHV